MKILQIQGTGGPENPKATAAPPELYAAMAHPWSLPPLGSWRVSLVIVIFVLSGKRKMPVISNPE
ncbi:MAG: hypothetical protein ACLPT4_01030, partial [Verrucomicrobiia bacterium]